jgi:hypothetical protein
MMKRERVIEKEFLPKIESAKTLCLILTSAFTPVYNFIQPPNRQDVNNFKNKILMSLQRGQALSGRLGTYTITKQLRSDVWQAE